MRAIAQRMLTIMGKQLIPGCVLLFIMSFDIQLLAQVPDEPHCGTTEIQEELYKQYPELREKYQEFLKRNAKEARDENGRRSTVYVIPVVFHVLHQYGSENISDAQIYDEMEILNRDFRKLNSDTTDIVPEFKGIASDARIEFRLATRDPAGNCTNGIDRIYTHETVYGDIFSKLNQWRRASYLNVWVVRTMSSPGVAGYALYPSAVDGQLYYADGIVVLHNYVGSIGTSIPSHSRTLTHEIGHYLGLSHTWGSTNNPGVACGDDGIHDTPITKGWTNCNLVNNQVCTPGIVENVQNYMEYAYCSRMFTEGQVSYMRSVLEDNTAKRDNLVTVNNLELTGADVQTAPLCTPVPEFTVNRNYICEGGTVGFTSQSWRAQVDEYEWTFEGGSPSSSNNPNPFVTYNNPGIYSVKLAVSNAAGTENITKEQFILVSPSGSTDYSGYFSEDFESNHFENEYLVENDENNEAAWSRISDVGFPGNHCLKLDNYQDKSDPFYFGRLGGSKDAFVSPSMDISSVQGSQLSFRYTAATTATSPDQITDLLRVYASTNCGMTWNLLRTIKGAELASADSGVRLMTNRLVNTGNWLGLIFRLHYPPMSGLNLNILLVIMQIMFTLMI